ncbi:MAG: hypothetical protein COB30_020780 [Ectothiorhodospiraceae bacterium]|nr:hypothetical protein [Ectothiorhodospiraceae bacterium]
MMNISAPTSALNSGINGITQGLSNFRRDASTIAQAVDGQPADIASALVDIKRDSLQIQASSKVVEAVDKTLGSLLDVLV